MSHLLQYRVLLTGPDGVEDDITSRVEISSLGKLTEELEDDLLQLTHSDISLEVDDADGWATARLGNATRGEVWEVVVERETGRRRPLWERIFGGVLDVPGSIVFDKREKLLELEVWSYSKLLELYPASPLALTVTNHTATTTSGTATATISPGTSELRAGDKITVTSGTSETRTIATIVDSTSITVTENWGASFTAAPLVLDTPYPRSSTAEELAADLYAAAGIPDATVDVGQILSGSLFPTAMSSTGLPGGTPDSLLEFGGKLLLYLGGKRYEATSSSSGWTDMGADTVKLDWHPYLATEPAALQPGTKTQIYDYVDAAHPYYSLQVDHSGGNDHLRIYKNGAQLATVASVDRSTPVPDGEFLFYTLELMPYWAEVWVSYRTRTKSQVREWDPDFGFIWVTHYHYVNRTVRYDTAGNLLQSMTGAGYLRCVRADDRMAWLKTHDAGTTDDAEPVSQIITLMYHGSAAVSFAAGSVDMWTFRKVGTAYYAGVSGGDVVLWDAATRELLATYPLVATPTGLPQATVFTKGGTIDAAYDGWTSAMYFSLAVSATNVIPYADFEDMSCAAAMRELAIVTMSHFFVDQYKIGYLIGREASWITSRAAAEPDDPLEQQVRPVWDNLRRSVSVSGTAEDGTEIEALAGEAGDSQSRLELATELPLTSGLAGVLAAAYLAYLSVSRQQSTETIEEPETGPVRVLDRVARDERTWVAQRVEWNLRDREQELLLVEEVA